MVVIEKRRLVCKSELNSAARLIEELTNLSMRREENELHSSMSKPIQTNINSLAFWKNHYRILRITMIKPIIMATVADIGNSGMMWVPWISMRVVFVGTVNPMIVE